MHTTRTSPRIILHLLVICAAVCLSTCRPQNTIDNQDMTEYQTPNDDDQQQLYSSYQPQGQSASRLQYYFDNVPLQRVQWMIGKMRPSSGSWNALYRIPESKRQVRYRQCYFNPISCFRK